MPGIRMRLITRSEYRGALKVRTETQRDLDYIRAEGEPTPETVAVLAALVTSLDEAVREYESRGWLGRLLIIGRGRPGTLTFSAALSEHDERIQRLIAPAGPGAVDASTSSPPARSSTEAALLLSRLGLPDQPAKSHLRDRRASETTERALDGPRHCGRERSPR